MKYLVIVKGDMNDADYVSEVSEIDKDEIEILTRIAGVIKDYTKANPYKHNWPSGEYCSETIEDIYKDVLSEDDIEFMYGIVPYCEDGIHTIEEIRILKVEDDVKVL